MPNYNSKGQLADEKTHRITITKTTSSLSNRQTNEKNDFTKHYKI